MNVELKNKVGDIFCEELTITDNSYPCKCGIPTRSVFIASTKNKVNLKKDIILYWCSSCDSPRLLNDGDRKNNVIYPTNPTLTVGSVRLTGS